MKKTLMLLVVATWLSACADQSPEPQIVTLQNPKTSDTIRCNLNPPATTERDRHNITNCVDGYTKAGWILVQ